MRIKLSIALVASLLTLGALSPSRASDLYYVSGPGGPFVGYTVPLLVISRGDRVTYMNADAFEHDVVSREITPGIGPAWCTEDPDGPGPQTPLFPEPDTCPVFWTPLIGIAGQSPIYGLDYVEAGGTYEFYCSIHGNMDGTLMVLP